MAIGAAVGAITGTVFSGPLTGAVVGAFGGLLPDCDILQSKGTRLLWTLVFVSFMISFLPVPGLARTAARTCLLAGAVLLFMLILGAATGHRVATHSITALFAATVAGIATGYPMLGVGYAFHLVADALTPEGITLLWPWSYRRFSYPVATTGGVLDFLLGAGATVVAMYVIFGH